MEEGIQSQWRVQMLVSAVMLKDGIAVDVEILVRERIELSQILPDGAKSVVGVEIDSKGKLEAKTMSPKLANGNPFTWLMGSSPISFDSPAEAKLKAAETFRMLGTKLRDDATNRYQQRAKKN